MVDVVPERVKLDMPIGIGHPGDKNVVADYVLSSPPAPDRELIESAIERCLEASSLLLAGPVGTGKTYQAYGAVRALAAASVRAQWVLITAADFPYTQESAGTLHETIDAAGRLDEDQDAGGEFTYTADTAGEFVSG